MPSLILYTGKCRSITEHGLKFTSNIRTHIVDDKVAKHFVGIPGFQITTIKKEAIIPDKEPEQAPEGEQAPALDDMRKRLSKLTVDKLKEMCEMKKLPIDGKKEELIDRLISVSED